MAGLDSSFKSQAFAGMQMNESIETQQLHITLSIKRHC